ncbi:hypothetical protein [Aquihabitans sp. McL0605]|uniref:hypothetical protein n=1 Tax=Aquihabitans sp. McL0605 TaxID=3415671 RepID=UPI003CE929E4
MLLIFGFRVRMKTVGTLVFFCPGCGGDRNGLRQVARRWFTFFFIPIIPLNVVGEVVRCETCSRTYRPDVLERPTTAALGQTLDNAIRALAVMIVGAGDRGSGPVRAKAVELVGSVAPGYGGDTLDSDLQVMDPGLATQYVAPLAEGLAPAGAERFLSDLVRVATAGGPMSAGQRQIIDDAGRTLGLSAAYVVGIIASAGGSSATPAAPPSAPASASDPTAPGTFQPPFADEESTPAPGLEHDPAAWSPPDPGSRIDDDRTEGA